MWFSLYLLCLDFIHFLTLSLIIFGQIWKILEKIFKYYFFPILYLLPLWNPNFLYRRPSLKHLLKDVLPEKEMKPKGRTAKQETVVDKGTDKHQDKYKQEFIA